MTGPQDVLVDLRRAYDGKAEWRDARAKQPWKLAERAAFLDRLPPAARLLEVGAGPGHDSAFFAAGGLSVTGGPLPDDDHGPPRFFSVRTDEQLLAFVAPPFTVLDFHLVDTGETDGERFPALTPRTDGS